MDEQRNEPQEVPTKEVFPCAHEQLSVILARLKQEQEYDRNFLRYDHPLSALEAILNSKRNQVATAIHHSRVFQEDVLTFLRAFSLMLGMVGNAATHGEKAARLRGLVELVESAAEKVRERQFREQDAMSFGMLNDVFRCDYPVRRFMEQAQEAKRALRKSERENAKLRGEDVPEDEDLSF